MSTVNRHGNTNIMITKGAVDVLLSRITKIATRDGIKEATAADIQNIEQANETFSKQGLRVLAFAYKPITNSNITVNDEQDLIFVGLRR